MASIFLFAIWLEFLLVSLYALLPPLSSSIFSPDLKYIVLPVDVLGLANRLRIIASFYAIAKYSHRSLVVVWAPSEECNVEFDELFDITSSLEAFELDVVIVSPGGPGPLDNGSLLNSLKLLHKDLNRHMVLKFPGDYFVDTSFLISSPSDGDEISYRETIDIVTMRTASTHAPLGISCADYSRLKMEFYASLTPATEVRDMQNEALGLLYSVWGIDDRTHKSPIVGVHVRMYDDEYDWAVVPPEYREMPSFVSETIPVGVSDEQMNLQEAPVLQQAVTFDESTPVLSIIAAMEDILEKHLYARFFLASNRNDVKEAIISHFDNSRFDKHRHNMENKSDDKRIALVASLMLPSGVSGRSSVDGMQMALLEFTLLGGLSDLLLHSKGSSFASEAAFMPTLRRYSVIHSSSTTESAFSLSRFVWKRGALGEQYPVPVVDVFAVSADSLGAEVQGKLSANGGMLLEDGRIRLNVYTTDVKLKECGMHDFLNSNYYNHTGNLVCYYEKTGLDVGGRRVCTHRLLVSRCYDMSELWGISHLYCASPSVTHGYTNVAHFLPETIFVNLDISGYSAYESS